MVATVCSLCGGSSFRERKVLWPELVTEWQLAEHERDYIDRQQGCACDACGANLRIIALGNAIRSVVQTPLPLSHAISRGELTELRILDCNGAESISAMLSALPLYQRIDYPEYDLRHLPFADSSFDIILHSDTLEHVQHPVLALEECRRLLSITGRLCFTIPIIIERLSRDRAGLPPSYHGDASLGRADYVVHTEFGADAWALVHRAGFTNVLLNQVEFPSGIAITAWCEAPVASCESAST